MSFWDWMFDVIVAVFMLRWVVSEIKGIIDDWKENKK